MGEDDVAMPEQDRDRWPKFALVMVGIGTMAVMGLWHQHSHLGHSHDDGHDHGAQHEAHDHDEAGHEDHDEDEAGHEDHDDHDHEDHAWAGGPPGRLGLLPEAGALAV